MLLLALSLCFPRPIHAADDYSGIDPLDDETRIFDEVTFPDRLTEALRDVSGVFSYYQPAGVTGPTTSLEPNGPRGKPQFRIDGTVHFWVFPKRTTLQGDLSVEPHTCKAPAYSNGYRLLLTFEDSPPEILNNAQGVFGDLCLAPSEKPGKISVRFVSFMIRGNYQSRIVSRKLYNVLSLQAKPLFDAIQKRALSGPLDAP